LVVPSDELSSEELSACPGCGRKTKTVVGRCPNCGYAKTSAALSFRERYIARGPGPDAGPFSQYVLTFAPGLVVVSLGVYVFDSVALTVIGTILLLLGPVVGLLVRMGS
jgi:hypothetical protein